MIDPASPLNMFGGSLQRSRRRLILLQSQPLLELQSRYWQQRCQVLLLKASCKLLVVHFFFGRPDEQHQQRRLSGQSLDDHWCVCYWCYWYRYYCKWCMCYCCGKDQHTSKRSPSCRSSTAEMNVSLGSINQYTFTGLNKFGVYEFEHCLGTTGLNLLR